MRKEDSFEFGTKRPLAPKFGLRDPNHLKNDCWGPGESTDTHIVGFVIKVQIFEFGAKGPLGPNLDLVVQITLTDCWGPGESIDTHIVGFCKKIADF